MFLAKTKTPLVGEKKKKFSLLTVCVITVGSVVYFPFLLGLDEYLGHNRLCGMFFFYAVLEKAKKKKTKKNLLVALWSGPLIILSTTTVVLLRQQCLANRSRQSLRSLYRIQRSLSPGHEQIPQSASILVCCRARPLGQHVSLDFLPRRFSTALVGICSIFHLGPGVDVSQW